MRHIALLFTLLIALSTGADSRFAYSYQRGSDDGVSIMRGNLDEWLRIKRTLGPGPYLWARLDGREYVVRDAGFLGELEDTFKPHRELDRELRKLTAQMEAHERRIDRLEDEIDDIRDRDDDLSSADEARLRVLESELREAERALRPLEQRERELERREDEIDRRVDAALEELVKKAVRDGIARPFRD